MRMFVAAVVTLLLLMSTPASALGRTATTLGQGYVEVGEHADPACGLDTARTYISGRGLWFPFIRPADRGDMSVYQMSIQLLPAIGDRAVSNLLDGPGATVGSGELYLCGTMISPTVGHANCFDSRGTDGFGEADFNVIWPAAGYQREVRMMNVGWAQTVGKTVPITGTHEVLDGNGDPTGELGQFLAVLQMQGGQACLDGSWGARFFVTAGVFTFTGV